MLHFIWIILIIFCQQTLNVKVEQNHTNLLLRYPSRNIQVLFKKARNSQTCVFMWIDRERLSEYFTDAPVLQRRVSRCICGYFPGFLSERYLNKNPLSGCCYTPGGEQRALRCCFHSAAGHVCSFEFWRLHFRRTDAIIPLSQLF